MPRYLVTADQTPRGTVYLGTHNASNPENAVQRARENYEADNMMQELAISKEKHFRVHELKDTTTLHT